jgi:hypothetical protein
MYCGSALFASDRGENEAGGAKLLGKQVKLRP